MLQSALEIDTEETSSTPPSEQNQDDDEFNVDGADSLRQPNLRELAINEIGTLYNFGTSEKDTIEEIITISEEDQIRLDSIATTQEKKKKEKLKDIVVGNVKYRRNSLYTLMIEDTLRQYNNIIRDAFGNAPLSEKYNDHNVGPYLIYGKEGDSNQKAGIDQYLEDKQIAKRIVAKWFQRDSVGYFNTSVIAERGLYDASALDISLASSSERGTALLADAGIELIGKTFVIVNSYKFTNKEEVAEKARIGLAALGAVTGSENLTNTLSAAVTVAGKGYIIKTTSYLYKLHWNDSIEAVFYQQQWADKNYQADNAIQNFLESNMFKMKFIGEQTAWADVQSSIFSNKKNSDLIKIATVKATDKAYAKLSAKYEEFRTKTPIHSVNPITAKIGVKEDLRKNQKFEILEQILNKDGKTSYKKVGTIKVGSSIWDNSYLSDDAEAETSTQTIDATTFVGSSKGIYPGMLIRQLN